MDAAKVAGCFRDRTILITGSTGFLGKSGVKKLYLLVRAPDDAAAHNRVLQLQEVVGQELFRTLREIHGDGFHSFIQEKVSPVARDIRLHSSQAKQLSEEIDIIVNGAAITNFYERYDVALASNALGTMNVCQFAKQCARLKMLLHVSTAYVLTGEQEGLLPENLIQMGETPKPDRYLDIEAELELVSEVKATLTAHSAAEDTSSQQLEKKAMKELGLNRANNFGWPNVYVFTKAMGEMLRGSVREDLPVVIVRPSMTIDALIVGYDEQTVPCFIGDRSGAIDAIPGDMVVNAAMVAMAAHYGEKTQIVYHVTSAHQNPLQCYLLEESTYGYFFINPRHKKLLLFNRYPYFHAYMVLAYKTPLQLWGTTTGAAQGDGYTFNFDPNCINWRLYLFNVHIPAVLKISRGKKDGRA
ncbi:hypothetical protein PVAP13_2KG419105 [Panicum virgatum]|uniref:Fatty acyl-CoA reductase n=1 Tax=Panicum virgatum TaxID=38727 RepID=A0A8T0WDD4_PANVG|nr:hypothetical protein PVAP13_2KG419105 [Panicum virgatum]